MPEETNTTNAADAKQSATTKPKPLFTVSAVGKSTSFFFPNSEIGEVHQTGAVVADYRKGVHCVLHFKHQDRRADDRPTCAEVFSDDGEIHAEIGLEYQDGALSGYDGVFDLPKEVLTAFDHLGLPVAADLREDYGAEVMKQGEARIEASTPAIMAAMADPCVRDRVKRWLYDAIDGDGDVVDVAADARLLAALLNERADVILGIAAPKPARYGQGTPVRCNGYDGVIVRHYDGNMYEVRLPGGVCCTDQFEVLLRED